MNNKEYTCPMHPQVVQPAAGSCPICGMRLELKVPVAHDEEDDELRDMSRRFWVGLALSIPIFFLANFHSNSAWIQALLATPVVL